MKTEKTPLEHVSQVPARTFVGEVDSIAAARLGVVSLSPTNDVGTLESERTEEGDRAGICGSRLVYPDNTIQHCGMKLGPLEVGPYHWNRGKPSRQVPRACAEFQAVTAACMLIRHEVIAEIGGFDETFPFAWEDVDFCLRARQKGWRVVCCNEVTRSTSNP